MSEGVAIVTKPNTASGDGFGKGSFDIDAVGGKVTCPSGVVRAIGGLGVSFTSRLCPADCVHRRVCLGKSGKRIIKLRKHEASQQDAENFAQTDRGKELLSLRPAIERVIAHWMRNGARQARYFGRLKVWMQCVLSAMMCNVSKIAGKTGKGGPNPRYIGPGMPLFGLAKIFLGVLAAISTMVGVEPGFGRQPSRGSQRTVQMLKKALSSGVS